MLSIFRYTLSAKDRINPSIKKCFFIVPYNFYYFLLKLEYKASNKNIENFSREKCLPVLLKSEKREGVIRLVNGFLYEVKEQSVFL